MYFTLSFGITSTASVNDRYFFIFYTLSYSPTNVVTSNGKGNYTKCLPYKHTFAKDDNLYLLTPEAPTIFGSSVMEDNLKGTVQPSKNATYAH